MMTQSMWGWLVWFPALFLVHIWVTNGASWVGASSNPGPTLCFGGWAEVDMLL